MMYQEEQLSILAITIFIGVIFWMIGNKASQLSGREAPNRTMAAVVSYVEFITDYTESAMGKRYGRRFAAYIGALFFYLLVANFSGLIGLSPPTSNFSVTLVLAVITWLSIQGVKFKENGIKGYFKSFIEPMPFFLIPNIFSEISPLISLSLRLFGNVLSGSVIMSLLYMFTGWVSQFLPIIGEFNFLGVIVAPVLHIYFDIFVGFLQAFLFISLTIIFIGMEVPRDKK